MEKLKKNIDLFVGAIFIIYFIFLMCMISPISFKWVFIILGIGFIVYHYMKNKIKKEIKYIINSIFIIGLLAFIMIQGFIIFYSKDNTSTADYMIILGAGINGEELSLTLQQRLDKAMEYINNYDKDIKIIVSGGQGPNEDISEASAMEKYLISKGISDNQIFIEDMSTSTYENFKYSYDKISILENENIKNLKIKVVTSDFHAFRSSFLSKRNGFENVTFYTNKSYIPLIPVMYTREAFAVVKSYIFDK